MAAQQLSPSTALLFAGQGTDVSKTINKLMSGPNSEQVREYFTIASTILEQDFLDLCQNQPKELLKTKYSQPAIFITSLAMAFTSKSNVEQTDIHTAINSATCVAGFSLGEYAALVYAGAMSFEDGVRLVKLRAEAMEVSASESNGSMVTVMGLTDDQLNTLCLDAIQNVSNDSLKNDDTISIANHLFPKGRVLSGHELLVDWVVENAKKPKYGALMVNPLPVAGAFHSKYMESSRSKLHEALLQTEIQMPNLPVYSNVTAKPYSSIEEIRELLVQQLEAPVLWEQTVKNMLSSSPSPASSEQGGGPVTNFVDVGPGNQLKTMIRRIEPKAFKNTLALDK